MPRDDHCVLTKSRRHCPPARYGQCPMTTAPQVVSRPGLRSTWLHARGLRWHTPPEEITSPPSPIGRATTTSSSTKPTPKVCSSPNPGLSLRRMRAMGFITGWTGRLLELPPNRQARRYGPNPTNPSADSGRWSAPSRPLMEVDRRSTPSQPLGSVCRSLRSSSSIASRHH